MSNVDIGSDPEVVSFSYAVPGWLRWPVAVVCAAYAVLALALLLNPESAVPVAGSNFVPFRTIRLQLEHGFIDQLVGNTLLLAPFGFAFRIWDRSMKWILVTLLAIAVGIEVAQEIVDRVTDIDDVILNVFGGFVGSLLGAGAARIVSSMAKTATLSG